MALFPCSRLPSDFMKGKRLSAISIPSMSLSEVEKRGPAVSVKGLPIKTPWGAPLVWGDSESSARRREEFGNHNVHIGLAILAVGKYNHFLHRLIYTAELHFLLNFYVTYYILTDRPRELDPSPMLGPTRELKVVPVAEMPGWDKLGLRRMALLAAIIGDRIHSEMDYVFCIDADQEFSNAVGAEILGKLTATLHPEFYGKPRYNYPYEEDPDSMAFVADGEGDYYYTSEFYGGLCSEVLALTRACSLLILQDQERSVIPELLEESYLNRYLVNCRPSTVLSPEYSWWDSPETPEVPTPRIHSIGRQCLSTGNVKGDIYAC
ncbi:globoside alpha-1,3-N-acetylgalactosaminyltransferase 1-like isoform X2 [Hoplias malabaricus]|uniref:globoside alpha-1,3-N-acetylgalactosaminyltransferase 1-like isoform X2 n=1 Tax=Hoplias malabaricus TaxID=27720 RepID=UPI003462B702